MCLYLSIQVAAEGYNAVVNCTGLGARELVGDTSLQPVRGQVLRVTQHLVILKAK